MTDPKHAVGVLWDLNICGLSKNYDVSKTREKLHEATRRFHSKYVITTMLLCGNLGELTNEQLKSLQEQGFNVVPGFERYPRCSGCKQRWGTVAKRGLSPDLYISSYMLGEALLHRLPENVLLISGDTGYCVALDYLAKSGKKIFLGVPTDYHRTLRNHGDLGWYWPVLRDGGEYEWIKLQPKRVGVNIVPWD